MNQKTHKNIATIGFLIFIIGIFLILFMNQSNDEITKMKNNYNNRSYFFDFYQIADVGQSTWGLSTVDFNKDGKIDFLASYADSPFTHSTISIFYNNGNLSFTKKDLFKFDYNYINNLVSGDFNSDGNIDILFTSNEWISDQGFHINVNGTIFLLINDGKNNFKNIIFLTRRGSGVPYDLESEINPKVTEADYNLDGNLDFVVGDNSGKMELYFNDGAGNFSSAGVIYDDGIVSWGITSTDIDHDNDSDLLFAVAEKENRLIGHIFLLKNQFFPSQLKNCFEFNSREILANISGTPATGSLTTLDYENDGNIDFLFGTSNFIYLYLINGSGRYNPFLVYKMPNSQSGYLDDLNYGALATADFNNDGYEDFIAGGNQGVVRLFINDHIHKQL